MNLIQHRILAIFSALIFLVALVPASLAQETRSMIFGRVLDHSGAVVPAAHVTVVNNDTNVATALTTNGSGYYEAPLLLTGTYTVTVEAKGFSKTTRPGIVLPISTRQQVDVTLEAGADTQTVTVTADTTMIQTDPLSGGFVIDSRSLHDLPTLNNNSTLLAKLAPGIQSNGGADGYTNPAFGYIGTSFSVAGNVGGNDFTIDGIPNNGNIRRVSAQPPVDAVGEFKVDTSNFDVSVGHTSGASFAVSTKSGTNDFHGSLSEQHWRNSWNAANFFVKLANNNAIAAAQAAGNTSLADSLKGKSLNPAGHSNNYTGTIGGPVRIPWIYNGRDKMFFFFSYSGLNDRVSANTVYWNRTVPTLAERNGDFSDLLTVDPVQYQIYDPLSTRPDPARPGHVIRDPFPGNIIPKSRMINPTYNFYSKLLPNPNNGPANATVAPFNNYYASKMPWRFDYKALTGRVDYQLSDRHRFYVRTQYWTNNESNQDWLYETAPGFGGLVGNRLGIGSGVDWIWTPAQSWLLDFSVGFQRFTDSVLDQAARKIEPSKTGLPSYIDQYAGAAYTAPLMRFSGYDSLSWNWMGDPARYDNIVGKVDGWRTSGRHTIRFGFDQYQLAKTNHGFNAGINTSGNFNFDNTFTSADDDGHIPAGSLGHSWAAFLMGLPTSASIATSPSVALRSAQYGWYVEDGWRATPRLSLNFGLRMEYETGATVRHDQALGAFDPNAQVPIAADAQGAYSQNPLAELPAAQFKVVGGATYIGANGAPRALWANKLMYLPRFAATYAVTPQLVLRGGYGVYYDTRTVRDFSYGFPPQSGYSRTTNSTFSTDFGQTWASGDPKNGVSPLTNPFPVRSDGTQFDVPVGNALGASVSNGAGYSYVPYDLPRARQQRWRAGVEQQFGNDVLVEIAYAGSYSDDVEITQTMQPLPQQYWATGMVRNNAIASDLTKQVTNPFYIGNFADLKASNPVVYQSMIGNGFFTSKTIQKNRLLRPFPHVNGLNNSYSPLGRAKTTAIESRLSKRFSHGFNLNLTYTRMWGNAADYFYNEYDTAPSWRPSSQTRPHRVTGTAVFEMPWGRGKMFWNDGWKSKVFGGFQVAGTYEYQQGPLLGFPNLFFYGGNILDIRKEGRNFLNWFNTNGFETNASKAPASYHARVFPVNVPGLRADSTNIWNGNVQRTFNIREKVNLMFRFDALNLFNRTTFSSPNTSPTSGQFAMVTNVTGTPPRYLQIMGRLTF
ncbi:MAG: carboxypeptidase regulatory-like domain-containing protein [Acidobacteria bacterium]|nr:carboxypeptidase regulatory-like domain-containing protein [Acidobacteriota bacterium]